MKGERRAGKLGRGRKAESLERERKTGSLKQKRQAGSLRAAAGIICGLFAAFAGVWGLREGLRKSGEEILSQEGSVSIEAQGPKQDEGGRTEKKDSLTVDEMVQALEHLENSQVKMPHEPGKNQLSMGEAVEAGRKWLKEAEDFLGFLFENADSYETFSAELNTGQFSDELEGLDKSGDLDEGIYGFWTVCFRYLKGDVTLTLNAVSGQVFGMTAYSSDGGLSDLEKEAFLQAYCDSLGLKADAASQRQDRTVRQSLEGGRLSAVLKMGNVVISDGQGSGQKRFFGSLQLFLEPNPDEKIYP